MKIIYARAIRCIKFCSLLRLTGDHHEYFFSSHVPFPLARDYLSGLAEQLKAGAVKII